MARLTLILAGVFVSSATSPWMITSDPAEVRAVKLLNEMNMSEKLHMLKGNNTMKPYVGGVAGNTRLGIPDLTLNDGPQGFRDNDGHPGTSTQMPGGINIGATWSLDMAQLWGATMGAEFLAKGSNVQLGPGLCINRVPYNGRNFEYISGEDPHLGYMLSQPAVQGIQSTGVIANAKHWVLNSQETNRTTQSAEIDERTLNEIYLPPFEGAIKAGVGSVMCSYNKIGGQWSCEHPETLKKDLKDRLGFDGWVMSDWGATHSASINDGLDQEMPGGSKMTGAPDDQGICRHDLCKLIQNGTVTEATVNESVKRILIPMFRMGLFDRKPQGFIDANVSTPAHSAVSRKIAAASMVLLKNEKSVLPLNPGLGKLAVIGEQAANPVTGGGGSGSVSPPYVISPLDAISRRFGSHTKVAFDDGKDNEKAGLLAASADVAVVFASTKSGEGADRKDLSLYDGWNGDSGSFSYDKLISTVATACAKTGTLVIVVMVSPGAVLTPWRDSVQAIISAFMPGQEYGNAITDILWGYAYPTARLPVTFPDKENQWGFTKSQWPGIDLHSDYSEKLEVGYRYYDAHVLDPAYPFGHGLSYTSFEYSNIKADKNEVSFTLKNNGDRNGTEVAQLYLGFPRDAGEPPKQLKGFKSVTLSPGESTVVALPVEDRSVSIWDVSKHAWTIFGGEFQAHVGSSSRDIRLSTSFSVSSSLII